MMKKNKILALALALVLAVAAVVCVSCAKKEDNKLEKGNVSYTVVNNTGKNVTEITLSDTRSDNKMTSKPENGGLPNGESIGIELPVMMEKNAPDVMFGYTVEGGDSVTGHIMQQNGTITMVTKTDGISYDITQPGK